MKSSINLPRDKDLLILLVSAVVVILGLVWMFFGYQLISAFVPRENQSIFYYFFSGVIFSLSIIGIYGFIRTVLYFTDFLISRDNLISLMQETLLNEEHEGLFLKNRQGIYKLVSPVAKNILGFDNKQIIGLSDYDLHKHRTANKIVHEDQRILEFGETIIWETTKQTSSGNQTFLCKKIPCRNHKGRIIGIVGTCKNITILKTLQQANQQQEERYRNLFNKLPYPVLVLDSISLQPFTFNNAMSNLLGYEKEEFARMRMSLHIDPDKLLEFKNKITEILSSSGGNFDLSLVTKNRDTIYVTGYAQEIIINDKVYLHMLLYDNTETKKSTETLISSELKYRSLFEHANDAIIVVSPNTLNIIDANEIAISFLGYKRDDLLLMSIQDLDASHDHTSTQKTLTDLEIYNHSLYEHDIKNRKGDVLETEINAHKLNYGNEEVYQFVIRNIGARKATEAALKVSESRYRQMFESNMAIKLVIDPENFRIEDANPAAAEFYGYSIEELEGMDLAQINILSRDKLDKLIEQTREQSLGFYSCPHRLSNGEIRFVEVRDGPMEIEGKQLFYSIIHDVTASKEAENQVLVASKMFDYSTDAVMLINDNNQVVSVNYAFTQITGYQQSEIQNMAPELILASKNEILLNPSVIDSIKSTGQWKGEIWHRLKSGQSRPLSTSINSIRNENTNVSSYVVMLTPKFSQVIEKEDKIHYVDLTQLPNKSLFVDRLENAIERAKRNNNRLGVIFIDFKNFSEINALYSYDLGDQLLKAISNRLKYNTRNSDTISHFVSDDFAVLVEDLNDVQQMGIVAQKLLSTLSEDYQTDDIAISLNVSMGISIYPEDGHQSTQLLGRAQTALLTAKHYPGNHFELTSAIMNRSANLCLQIEENLHAALRKNQFFLTFLPQIDVDKNSLHSIEALIRWDHPEQGHLLPSEFLSSAEHSGFMGAIGTSVIELALRQYKTWLNDNVNIPRLSINISLSQVDIDLVDILTEKCNKYSIAPNNISLEFSEKSFIKITEEQKLILKELISRDFYICLDDFGSSNTSLNCLLKCKINAIKIDPILISKAHISSEARNLLTGIVSLCETQNIEIIAEGVESEEDYAYLRSLNIIQMQGHLFSEPLIVDKVPEFIRTFNNLH